jgi:hypothetical protein
MWKFIFTAGLAPCINLPSKSIIIGRNSEMENPMGPHFIARSRKKAAVTPYLFMKY